MSAPDALELITGHDDSLRAFNAFKAAFAAGASVAHDCCLGWSGGTVQADVYWHEKIRVWGVFRETPPQPRHKGGHRFWNCFGVSDPRNNATLNITVEINPPHGGENRRAGGVFLHDEEGRFCVGHSGRIGGGRRGVGQRAFREFSDHLAWQDITSPSGAREIIAFGPLQAGKLPDMLAPFVHTVAEFKDVVQIRR